MRKLIVASMAAVVVAACGGRTVEVAGGEVVTVAPADARGIPSGATLHTRLDQRLSAEDNKVGDRFTLSVTEDLVAQNGEIVVPKGSTVRGYITNLRESDNPQEKALIQLAFDRITVNGTTYGFSADVRDVEATGRRASTSEVLRGAAAGAAAGAVLGAIISGVELDGILKGGAIGAAAGTAISLGMGGTNNELPAGTMIELRSTQNVAFVR